MRSSGFKNVGLDLIYGLPDQSLRTWMETLKKALFFEPEHLSCYQLSIEAKTPFWAMVEKGEIEPIGEERRTRIFSCHIGISPGEGIYSL